MLLTANELECYRTPRLVSFRGDLRSVSLADHGVECSLVASQLYALLQNTWSCSAYGLVEIDDLRHILSVLWSTCYAEALVENVKRYLATETVYSMF
jgi:hypothetical protein